MNKNIIDIIQKRIESVEAKINYLKSDIDFNEKMLSARQKLEHDNNPFGTLTLINNKVELTRRLNHYNDELDELNFKLKLELNS